MVAHVDDHVRVHHVVDQRDVLVPDALDVVLAEAVPEQGRALQGLGRDDRRAVALLQVVACCDRARGAGRRDERPQAQRRITLAQRLEDVREGAPGDELVHEVIADTRRTGSR